MESNQLQVLLIEDNPAEAELIKEALVMVQGNPCDIHHVDRWHDALEIIKHKSFDVVLSDLMLPDTIGIDAVSGLHEVAPELPVIVITGLADEETAISALRVGVQDFLVKEELNGGNLIRSICYAIERHKLRRCDMGGVLYDARTGMYNASGFRVLSSQLIKLANRRKTKMLLLELTLSKELGGEDSEVFKSMLSKVSKSIISTFRESDVYARTSSRKFSILVTDTSQVDQENIVERFSNTLSENVNPVPENAIQGLNLQIKWYNPEKPVTLTEFLEKKPSKYEILAI